MRFSEVDCSADFGFPTPHLDIGWVRHLFNGEVRCWAFGDRVDRAKSFRSIAGHQAVWCKSRSFPEHLLRDLLAQQKIPEGKGATEIEKG
jgi:hypothetical protein